MGETWRVVLASGEVLSVEVQEFTRGRWIAVCGHRETFSYATPDNALRAFLTGFAVDADVREILAPGEPTRAELAAQLAATLETRTAEHALAMARVRELEAIIAGRTTPPTDAEMRAHDGAWLVSGRGLALALSGQKAADCAYNARSAGAEWRWLPIADDGRPCAWPTAEVSRG